MKKHEFVKGGQESKTFMVGRKKAAALFDVAPGTLANLLSQGRGPRAYKVGRKVLYKISDLEAFFTSSPIQTLDSIEAGHDCVEDNFLPCVHDTPVEGF